MEWYLLVTGVMEVEILVEMVTLVPMEEVLEVTLVEPALVVEVKETVECLGVVGTLLTTPPGVVTRTPPPRAGPSLVKDAGVGVLVAPLCLAGLQGREEGSGFP